ncbi:TRAP transporter small permease [Lacicoccus alkaliphilus]|uniref:TRAP-type C4-dicarboxylate transport system, small permease component n=1 Tax=Lacicoccus alkaliphilus DSM 16010 TaxID=1123231 RepID=A0A1M7CYJ4_9BACL|nr:TRAP transporter small permease [Salinicoccus alkaliphilus]SHL72332.1 TRAP-type C4-dicarboxylate transport system, small permease component [Salinicoccus alkaliphilus DSM 16010]
MKKTTKKPIEAYVSLLLLAVMTVIMFAEVIARYIFNSSISWSSELVRYLFIWFIFISASYAVVEKAHIRIESIPMIIPTKIRPYTNLIGKFIWASLSIFVAYIGLQYSLTVWNSTSPALQWSMGLMYLGIPIGYFLMTLRLIKQLIVEIRSLKSSNL